MLEWVEQLLTVVKEIKENGIIMDVKNILSVLCRVIKILMNYQNYMGLCPGIHFLRCGTKIIDEVIEQYRPDLIWFDSWLDRIPQKNRREFVNTYLEAASSWNKPVVITYKQNDLPQNVGIVDFEKGRLDRLTEYAWLTDDTISAEYGLKQVVGHILKS